MSDRKELSTVADSNPERCETCRFRVGRFILDDDGVWRPPFYPQGMSEREYESREHEEGKSGECHRFPPVARDSEVGEFPQVGLDDWCGEWQAKRD